MKDKAPTNSFFLFISLLKELGRINKLKIGETEAVKAKYIANIEHAHNVRCMLGDYIDYRETSLTYAGVELATVRKLLEFTKSSIRLKTLLEVYKVFYVVCKKNIKLPSRYKKEISESIIGKLIDLSNETKNIKVLWHILIVAKRIGRITEYKNYGGQIRFMKDRIEKNLRHATTPEELWMINQVTEDFLIKDSVENRFVDLIQKAKNDDELSNILSLAPPDEIFEEQALKRIKEIHLADSKKQSVLFLTRKSVRTSDRSIQKYLRKM